MQLLLGCFCPSFDCSVSDDACASQEIWWFGCHSGAVDGSGAVFEFISVVLVFMIFPPQKRCISASTGLFLPIFWLLCIRWCLGKSSDMKVWVSSGCSGWFWGSFLMSLCWFSQADYACLKWYISASTGQFLPIPILWLLYHLYLML